MTSRRFVALERRVEREYERKGYGRARALAIGRAVAGKVATAKRRANPARDRHCSRCGSTAHDARFHARRNPAKKPAPTHDLFGERGHKLDLFGGKEYDRLPAAKHTRGEKRAKERPGQGRLDIGGTRGLFG